MSGLQAGATKSQSVMNNLSQSMTKVGTALSIGVTAPLLLIAKAALSAGSSFESAFAGVRKTVAATESELARMREGFRKLALEIPISANEMAKIGEAAGALGVKSADILKFTRTMADLGVATNLTSDQAATGLARLANIIANEAGPQYDRLGATLVALGNAGASTESEILEMSLRIAGAGKQAGLSEADILGFANALSSVGIEAEAGGSSISRVFIKMADATKLGGKELQIFAQVAGQSGAEFKKAFGQDAAGAAISFIEGLGKIAASGKSLTPILKELELGDIRVSDALRRAAGSGDLFRESIELGSKAWQDNTALTKEAAERYKTFESQIQLVKNQLTDIAINIFDKLRPALTGMLESVKGAIKGFADLDESTIKAGATFLTVAGTAGPIALLAGRLLALGPQGALVAGVIAGVAAIAAAYATDFATVNRTINSHVALFTKGTGEMSGSWSSMTDKIEVGVLMLVTGFERIVITLERLAVNTVTAAKVMAAGLTGNWTGVIAAWSEGRAKLDAIDSAWEGNVAARVTRIHQIEGAAAWRDMWGKTAVANREGALASVKAWDDIFNKNNPATSLTEALIKHKGPTIEAARALGRQAGAEALGGWRFGIDQKSPSGFEKDLDRIAKAFADFPGKIVKHISGLSAAGKLLLKEFREAAKGIVDDLNTHIRSLEIDRLIRERIAPAIERLKERAKELSIQAIALGTAIVRDLNPSMQKMGEVALFGDGSLEALVKRMIQMKAASAEAAAAMKKLDDDFADLSDHFQDISRSLPQSWNTIIDGILNGTGKAGSDLLNFGVKIKGIAGDILGVFDTMPGKWGAALRKGLDEVNRWVNFIDSAMRLIQRIMGDTQTGIGGIFEKVSGLFKKTADETKSASQDWSGSLEKISKGSGETAEKTVSAFSMMTSAIAGFAAGASIAAATSSKAIGAIGGAAMGALQGFMVGGPVGAAVGGIAGLLGGIFGGGKGKSAIQKAQETAALQQAKDAVELSQQQVLQAVEQTKQSWIETLDKGRLLLESIAFYSKVPKLAFNQFFQDMGKLFKNMVELAKKWKLDATVDIKTAAENLGAGVSLLSQLPAALEGISKYLGTPDASFSTFFAAAAKYFDKLEEFLETIPKSVAKSIGKFSKWLSSGVSLLAPLTDGLRGLLDLKDIPTDAQFALVNLAVDKIITNIGLLGQKFEKGMLKQMAFFSEKAGAALSLWKDTIDAIKATVGIQPLSETDADNLISGLTLFIDKLTIGLGKLNTEELTRVSAIAQTILPIAGAIKAWADTSAAVRGYTMIAAEAWDAIIADFSKAIQLMGVLIGQAMQFEQMAITLETHLKSGAQHLADGIAAMSGAVLGTASALQSAFGHTQGGVSGGSVGAMSIGSAGMSLAPVTGNHSVNVGSIVINGSGLSRTELQDAVVDALVKAEKRGRRF